MGDPPSRLHMPDLSDQLIDPRKNFPKSAPPDAPNDDHVPYELWGQTAGRQHARRSVGDAVNPQRPSEAQRRGGEADGDGPERYHRELPAWGANRAQWLHRSFSTETSPITNRLVLVNTCRLRILALFSPSFKEQGRSSDRGRRPPAIPQGADISKTEALCFVSAPGLSSRKD